MELPELPANLAHRPAGYNTSLYGPSALRAYGIACAQAALDAAARQVENYCGAWDATGPVIAAQIRAIQVQP